MAITKFQPEVWSATLLTILQKTLIFAGPNTVNRNYEGEIANYGDTVHIVGIGRGTIQSYAKDTDLTVEVLTDNEQLLVIDQSKAFAFEVDDIDRRQAMNGGALMTQAASDYGYLLAEIADRYVATLMATGAQAGNVLPPLSITTVPTDAYDKVLVPLRIRLDKANNPQAGRWVIVDPDFYGKLLLDSRFIKVNESGTDDGLRNGTVGRAAGFDIVMSVNAPAGATAVGGSAPNGSHLVIAGTGQAFSYAEQINKVEAFRPEKRFADALKGLHLYGGKVVRPECLATVDVTVS